MPEAAVFRVVLEAVGGSDHPGQSWRGWVVMQARPKPLLQRFAEQLLSVFWREAGF